MSALGRLLTSASDRKYDNARRIAPAGVFCFGLAVIFDAKELDNQGDRRAEDRKNDNPAPNAERLHVDPLLKFEQSRGVIVPDLLLLLIRQIEHLQRG